MANQYTELAAMPSTELGEILGGLTSTQRDYLLFRAMGTTDMEARKILKISVDRLYGWKKSGLFYQKYRIIEESEEQWAKDAVLMFFDANLPFVVWELLQICYSGSEKSAYDKPHKDKERAIEFFLKELCGISRNVAKSYNFEQFLVELKDENNRRE